MKTENLPDIVIANIIHYFEKLAEGQTGLIPESEITFKVFRSKRTTLYAGGGRPHRGGQKRRTSGGTEIRPLRFAGNRPVSASERSPQVF
jgi:hypothetical protein